MADAKVSADALLARLKEKERARLRIYIGAAPGVGKTYALLREAHALRARGLDVAIGLIETYGRTDTDAQLQDLEVIPLAAVEYRGTTSRSFSCASVSARLYVSTNPTTTSRPRTRSACPSVSIE